VSDNTIWLVFMTVFVVLPIMFVGIGIILLMIWVCADIEQPAPQSYDETDTE